MSARRCPCRVVRHLYRAARPLRRVGAAWAGPPRCRHPLRPRRLLASAWGLFTCVGQAAVVGRFTGVVALARIAQKACVGERRRSVR